MNVIRSNNFNITDESHVLFIYVIYFMLNERPRSIFLSLKWNLAHLCTSRPYIPRVKWPNWQTHLQTHKVSPVTSDRWMRKGRGTYYNGKRILPKLLVYSIWPWNSILTFSWFWNHSHALFRHWSPLWCVLGLDCCTASHPSYPCDLSILTSMCLKRHSHFKCKQKTFGSGNIRKIS